MSGYLRAPAKGWDEEHYTRAAWLGRARSAPDWWIALDIAWHVDRRELPAARKAAEHWGVDKNKASKLIREGTTQQAAWEKRPVQREEIRRLLEEWCSKEPKRATAARVGTGKGQGRDSYGDTNGTGGQGETPTIEHDHGQAADTNGTGGGQGRDTSRASPVPQPSSLHPQHPPAPLPGGEADVRPPRRGRTAPVEQLWTLEHQRVWARYLELHPEAGLDGGACPPGDAALIRRELAVWGADRLLSVLDWAHASPPPDWYSAFLQGLKPGSDGVRQSFLGLDDLLASTKLSKRVDKAREWIDGCRRVEAEAAEASVVDPETEALAQECGLAVQYVLAIRHTSDLSNEEIRTMFGKGVRHAQSAPA